MATPVPKKKGNRWTVVVDLPSAPGKRKQKRISGKTKAEVEAKRDELIAQIRSGTYIKPSKQPLGEYLLQWVDDHDVAIRTSESYEEIIRNHLIPHLGSIPLTDLEPYQIQDYVRKAKKSGRLDGNGGLSIRSVDYHITILKKALNDAVDLNILRINPCNGVKVKSKNKNSSNSQCINVLSPDELKRLLLRVKNSYLYIPTLIAASTGMRLGEVLGLRWRDVDLNRRVINIQQASKLEDGKVVLGHLKTEGSARAIKVDRNLISALKSHKDKQEDEKLAQGKEYHDYDLVCAKPNGLPRHVGTVSNRFIRIVKTINLPVSFHDLRHTHATLLYEAGVGAKEIQERLGHYDLAFTLRIYCHTTTSISSRASDTYESIMYGKQEQINRNESQRAAE